MGRRATDIASDSRFARLVSRLGGRVALTRGHLECLTSFAFSDRRGGSLGTIAVIEREAEWEGAEGELARHLVATGWIEEVGGVYQMAAAEGFAPGRAKRQRQRDAKQTPACRDMSRQKPIDATSTDKLPPSASPAASPSSSPPQTPSLTPTPTTTLSTTQPSTPADGGSSLASKPRKSKVDQATNALPPIPQGLYGEPFAKAWGEYVTHRIEMHRTNGRPLLTPEACKKAFDAVRKLDDEVWAVVEVEHAIAQSWTGIWASASRRPHAGASTSGPGPPPSTAHRVSLADRARLRAQQVTQ